MEAAPDWAGPPVPPWVDELDLDVEPEPELVWIPASPARRALSAAVTTCWMLPLTVLMLVAIGMLVAKVVFGLTPLSVRSGSMEPTIPTYALAFVDSVSASQIEKGDVITFDPPGAHARVTHRVVKAYELNQRRYFETRGDANPSVDDWRNAPGEQKAADAGDASPPKPAPTQSRGITYDGKEAVRYVFHVPWLGHIGLFLERPDVRDKVIYLPFVLLAVWLLAMIWARPFSAEARQAAAGEWVPMHELPSFGTTCPRPASIPLAATAARLHAEATPRPVVDMPRAEPEADDDLRAA